MYVCSFQTFYVDLVSEREREREGKKKKRVTVPVSRVLTSVLQSIVY